VEDHVLDSAALGAARAVSVYCPPGHQGPLPGCVLADGGAARGFVHTLEPAILAGAVPPVLLVGVHNAFDPANPYPDRRAREYLPGHHRRRFDKHLRFVTEEVLPLATGQWGAAAGPWVAAGFMVGVCAPAHLTANATEPGLGYQ
jgi:enterochelin esterase-like enzyme